MFANPEFEVDGKLKELTHFASTLGFEIVDIAGFLDTVNEKSRAQLAVLTRAEETTANALAANAAVREAIASVHDLNAATLTQVDESFDIVNQSAQSSKSIASWVTDLAVRMEQLTATLDAVESNNDNIADIARQVNILAINAKIEAARAGESGRGFGVVAEAINELSQKTAGAADEIAQNIEDLSGWMSSLRDECQDASSDAGKVIEGASKTDAVLGDIADAVRKTSAATTQMNDQAQTVRGAMEAFGPVLAEIGDSSKAVADSIDVANERVNNLIDASEGIYVRAVDLGGAQAGEDLTIITKVQETAAQIGQAFEAAIAAGEISESHLFDTNYTPIPDSNPSQMMAKFTALTDRILPAIQEPVLKSHEKIIFCAAVDRNGYLPTHNVKFSQPQGKDPAWNAANSRNRRMFNDRVGLKAGESQQSFLLQIYRRDMGNGSFVLMKDISAPIWVSGRHWGGFRLGCGI